ncbi:DUF1214 domain-containing protein [Pyruvatibacter sp.]|uniref:DUF1214 domain-containing protein n=1 Tax=Pyruvatibacter sp. TaxID=1981328 RepID=UPI0032EE4839
MFRVPTVLKLLGVLVFAVVVGAGSAWWSILGVMETTGIRNGAWYTSTAIGSEASGPYMRAQIALTGLLALNKSEAIYFNASEDDEGRALSGACDYEVTGRNFAARWWSITAYGSDSFLMRNAAEKYSYNVASLGIRFAPISKWRINVSATEQERNWLPVTRDDFFSLTLRLYNPSPQIVTDPAGVSLPEIRRVACKADAATIMQGTESPAPPDAGSQQEPGQEPKAEPDTGPDAVAPAPTDAATDVDAKDTQNGAAP